MCYACNKEPIQGRTRLQKMIFLVQVDHQEWTKYNFIPEAFGPWSQELQGDLDDLVREKLITELKMSTQNGGKKYVYSISPKGEQEVRNLLGKSSETQNLDKLLKLIESTKKYASKMNLESLVSKIHQRYPELAKGNSDFRF